MGNSLHSHTYTLTAGESNAEGKMPLPLVVERVIEVATEHANQLDVGYATLIKKNIGWVLSRVAVEMKSYPAINEKYTLKTWVESYNRHFSQRNFEMTDEKGDVLGYMRTVWVAMDYDTRSVADLSQIDSMPIPITNRDCPINPAARLKFPEGDCQDIPYVFKYCDIDFNRHVNTVRYIDLILNQWPLEQFDRNEIERFDISFHQECHYGQKVNVRTSGNFCAISHADNPSNPAVMACIGWRSHKLN